MISILLYMYTYAYFNKMVTRVTTEASQESFLILQSQWDHRPGYSSPQIGKGRCQVPQIPCFTRYGSLML